MFGLEDQFQTKIHGLVAGYAQAMLQMKQLQNKVQALNAYAKAQGDRHEMKENMDH